LADWTGLIRDDVSQFGNTANAEGEVPSPVSMQPGSPNVYGDPIILYVYPELSAPSPLAIIM